jgi:hypothetical protein
MAPLPINNPGRILQTLDSYLQKETRVVLFGRAALALGFSTPDQAFGTTHDVDAILPSVEMARIEADGQFWDAIEKTNKDLESRGLYLSHLFTDRQVVLTPDWLEKIVGIQSQDYRFLRLSRPSSIDLVLTKMMRNDREDREDIQFILRSDPIDPRRFIESFKTARLPDIPEIRATFTKMQADVLGFALEAEKARGRDYPELKGRGVDPDWWEKLTKQASKQRGMDKERELEP